MTELEKRLIEQFNSTNDLIRYLQKRVKYLDIVVDELVYLAKCRGASFDHVLNKNKVIEHE